MEMWLQAVGPKRVLSSRGQAAICKPDAGSRIRVYIAMGVGQLKCACLCYY